MPELLHPGVYVQEVSSGVRPIEGVSTSTAAFIGVAEKGPIPGRLLPNGRAARPDLVTSLTEYFRRYGGFRRDSFLTYAVRSFYENGGRRLYVVRIAARVPDPNPNEIKAPTSATGTVGGVQFSAANEGAWGRKIWVGFAASSDGNTNNFKLQVMYGGSADEAKSNVVESYDGVTIRPADATVPAPSNYVRHLVNSRSEYVAITADVTIAPGVIGPQQLTTGGEDGTTDLATLDPIGSAAPAEGVTGTGLHALDSITDVNIIAAPGFGNTSGADTVLKSATEYCKNQRSLQDCFFVGDVGSVPSVEAARALDAKTDVAGIQGAVDFGQKFSGRSAGDYGAAYFPWVRSPDPIGTGTNPRILLPPSGFLAGIYARVDNSRGVFKAPAGTEAGVAGAVEAVIPVSDTEQDRLNPIGVNVIRTVPTAGLVVWGTRTIGSNAEWRYIPVRRMAIFLRVSIYYGIQWAVFEPNDEPLWSSLRLNIRAFMLTQFRAGAFQGAKPDDAFFVKCDATTTTQQDIDNGVVNILVGFAPLKPAEFVVLKLSQKVNQPAA
jgi:phage tail sheath protein FI